MHTARWVVDKCFVGPLLKGRTVILVTHNVAMTAGLAENVVQIASDGTITQKDSIADALSENSELRGEAAEDSEGVQKAAEIIDGSHPAEEPAKPSGKLIADEEVALGSVSMKASEPQLSLSRRYRALMATTVMLYFANMGGIGFWITFWGLLCAGELLNMCVVHLFPEYATD